MSRTYKDRPARVKSLQRNSKTTKSFHEVHYCHSHKKKVSSVEHCTIDELMAVEFFGLHCKRMQAPILEKMDKKDKKDYHSFHRQDERAVLTKIMGEYNSYHEIENDDIFTPYVKDAVLNGFYWR